MKIGQVSGVSGVYNKQGISKVERTKEVQGSKDVVSISGAGQDYNTAMKAMRDIPDVRVEKVEEFKAKVDNGTYNRSGDDIAEKILKGSNDKKA